MLILNHCCVVGRKLQGDFFNVLIRFRFLEVTMSVNFAKFVRQVELRKKPKVLSNFLAVQLSWSIGMATNGLLDIGKHRRSKSFNQNIAKKRESESCSDGRKTNDLLGLLSLRRTNRCVVSDWSKKIFSQVYSQHSTPRSIRVSQVEL